MNSIWAVAANTVKQALRLKIAVVFIILLVVLLPVMGITITGDGTIKGRLQTFVSYSLSLTSFLLSLLAMIISAYSLTSDIKNKQIYTVLTKPILRFQFIIGKLFGVVFLGAVLLTLFASVIYLITVYTPSYSNATEDELNKLNNEFLTARKSLKPVEIDVSKEVEALYEKLERNNQLPDEEDMTPEKFKARLTSRKRFEKQAAVPGRELVWQFDNIRLAEPNQSIFIRYKYDVSVNPFDLQVGGVWAVGDIRQLRYGHKVETPIRHFQRRDLIRTFHEIQVPADVVAADGHLEVAFLNDPRLNNTIVIFPPDEGLEILYKADTFGANFFRASVLIFFKIFFFACLGLLASTFLSFPVAILFCLVIFFTTHFSGFFFESFSYLSTDISKAYYYSIRWFFKLLPRFDELNPTKFLVPADLLSFSLVAKAALFVACIKSAFLLVIALLIFHFREIAKIVV